MADFYTGNTVRWMDSLGYYQGLLNYKDANGKWKQKTKKLTKKKRESIDLFNEWKAEMNRKAIASGHVENTRVSKGKTVSKRLEEYLAYRKSEVSLGHIEQSTLTKNEENARLYIFPEPIANMQYATVTKDDIVTWLTGLADKGLSQATIRNPYYVLKNMYDWDVAEGRLDISPFRFLQAPPKERKPVNYANRECCARLMSELDSAWNKRVGDGNLICFYMALYLGLRGEETCGLMWKDVHFSKPSDDGYIEITQSIARNNHKPYLKTTKTEKSYRKIYLYREIEQKLAQTREYQKSRYGVDEVNPRWFVSGNREEFRNPDNVSGAFYRFAKRRNLTGTEGKLITMHNLRDTFATTAVQYQTIDIKTLSGLLGHKDVSTTLNLYAGYGDDKQRKAGMNMMGSAMNDIRKNSDEYERPARAKMFVRRVNQLKAMREEEYKKAEEEMAQ